VSEFYDKCVNGVQKDKRLTSINQNSLTFQKNYDDMWICLNEEYMYMYIWLDYMMIDYGEGYYLVIDNNNLCT
jgi:hypothetical protein